VHGVDPKKLMDVVQHGEVIDQVSNTARTVIIFTHITRYNGMCSAKYLYVFAAHAWYAKYFSQCAYSSTDTTMRQ
jgi:hypothetical protein